eukprot:GEZU01042061.1.p1 GENE.GEZU01042061.1~~GEZU01042061.1.p1  ORF type:complete len:274 (+),score=61.16 GEZU01042061.1:49-822(+)
MSGLSKLRSFAPVILRRATLCGANATTKAGRIVATRLQRAGGSDHGHHGAGTDGKIMYAGREYVPFITREEADPAYVAPKTVPTREQPEYESPYDGPAYLPKDYKVADDLEMWWEDGVQREWAVDIPAPWIPRSQALKHFLIAFLCLFVYGQYMLWIAPAHDNFVPSVQPVETLKRDYLIKPENKELWEWWAWQMEKRRMRVEMMARGENHFSFRKSFNIFVRAPLACIYNMMKGWVDFVFTTAAHFPAAAQANEEQ